MTTAPAEIDWARMVITTYNSQSFLQINSELDFLVIWKANTKFDQSKKIQLK